MSSKQFPILVIDDDPSVGELLNRAAKKAFPEATFTCCLTVEEAIIELHAHPQHFFRLIFLDINLSNNVNGLDKIADIKHRLDGQFIPIVILTVSDATVDIQKAYQLGAASFIEKPSSYCHWISFLERFKLYWMQTATLPPLHR